MKTKRNIKKPVRRAPKAPSLATQVAGLAAAIQALASAQMEILQAILRAERRAMGEGDGIPPPDAKCVTTPDGGCIGNGCMHDPIPPQGMLVDQASEGDQLLA